jgi:hypothetical protein
LLPDRFAVLVFGVIYDSPDVREMMLLLATIGVSAAIAPESELPRAPQSYKVLFRTWTLPCPLPAVRMQV